jgi:hypothetical protein
MPFVILYTPGNTKNDNNFKCGGFLTAKEMREEDCELLFDCFYPDKNGNWYLPDIYLDRYNQNMDVYIEEYKDNPLDMNLQIGDIDLHKVMIDWCKSSQSTSDNDDSELKN